MGGCIAAHPCTGQKVLFCLPNIQKKNCDCLTLQASLKCKQHIKITWGEKIFFFLLLDFIQFVPLKNCEEYCVNWKYCIVYYILNFTDLNQLRTPIQKYLKILTSLQVSQPQGTVYSWWVHLIHITFQVFHLPVSGMKRLLSLTATYQLILFVIRSVIYTDANWF